MSPRQLPGALALGLLASLIAHAAGFGAEHQQGGAFNGLLLGLALVGPAAAVLGCALRRAAIPPAWAVLATSFGWFALAELPERAHASTPLALLALLLFAASLAVRLLALAAVRLIRAVACIIASTPYAPRARHARRIRGRVHRADLRLARRRFARPPPCAMLVHP